MHHVERLKVNRDGIAAIDPHGARLEIPLAGNDADGARLGRGSPDRERGQQREQDKRQRQPTDNLLP